MLLAGAVAALVAARDPAVGRKPIDLADAAALEANRPLLIAHRGGVVTAATPEGSLGAIRLAARRGYHMVELDVRASQDGVPVVFHDRTLERACGRPEPVSELPAAALAAIAFSGSEERVPLLRDALGLCRDLGLGIMLDMKTHDDATFVARVSSLVEEFDLERSAVTISRAETVRRHLEHVLFPIDERRLAAAAEDPATDLDGRFWFGLPERLPDEKVRALQKLGVLVFPAINTFRYPAARHLELARADIRRLLDAGVDGFQIDSVYESAFVGERGEGGEGGDGGHR